VTPPPEIADFVAFLEKERNDSPHTVKAYGYYNLKWWKFNTVFGAYQQIYSGTPLSSYISVWGAPVFVEGRGKFVDVTRDQTTGNWIAGNIGDKRTPSFSQSDLSVSQEFHLSKSNERLKAKRLCAARIAQVHRTNRLMRSRMKISISFGV